MLHQREGFRARKARIPIPTSATVPMTTSGTTTMMDLPPEIHLAIIGHLPYPDALSLKHSSRYFYAIVYTGINLKIEWLISRRQLHLECPQDGSCLLNSDRNFCRGSVRLLMLRRRQHWECDMVEGGRGCLVMGTKMCEWKRARSPSLRLRRWIHANATVMACALIGFLSVLWDEMRREQIEMEIGDADEDAMKNPRSFGANRVQSIDSREGSHRAGDPGDDRGLQLARPVVVVIVVDHTALKPFRLYPTLRRKKQLDLLYR